VSEDLARPLLEVHRAGARGGSLRDALQGITTALRTSLDLPWVLTVIWEPLSAGIRCSVVDGVDSDRAARLLRLAADWERSDQRPSTVQDGDPEYGEALRAGGVRRAAVIPMVDDDAEPFGVVVLAMGGELPTSAQLAEIGVTVTAEAVRAARDEQSQRRALYDAATGLPGPMLLEAVAAAADPDQELALLLVSVDQLQSVSRSFGRATGNEMLRKVAARLLVAGGAGAWSVYRLPRGLGVLTLGRPGTAAAAAETILTVMQEPWVLGRRSVRSTCRIGIAVREDDSTRADVLVERAEAALDAALTSLRGGAATYGPHLAATAHESLVLETLLQAALSSAELRVRYQPQVDVGSGAVTGAEALVRWLRPSGVVTPDRFIPAAEASGVIVELDRWVLAVACRQA
jgi:predicted signal transduction protein with EAL and GGDEF domain